MVMYSSMYFNQQKQKNISGRANKLDFNPLTRVYSKSIQKFSI